MNLHWASVFYGMDGAVGQICCIFLLLVLILLAGVESMDIFCVFLVLTSQLTLLVLGLSLIPAGWTSVDFYFCLRPCNPVWNNLPIFMSSSCLQTTRRQIMAYRNEAPAAGSLFPLPLPFLFLLLYPSVK